VVNRGVAVVANASSVSTHLIAQDSEIHIVRNEQVKQAVVIVVKKSGARAPAWVVNPCARRHIGEGSVPIVMVQGVVAESCNVQIKVPVVVIVARCDAHSEAGVR